jgi:hypothetical protein
MIAVKILIIILFCLSSSNYIIGQMKSLPLSSRDTMSLKVDSLKAAIVTAARRPHMKRDTLEYNTDRMLMPPNAEVEDLLRRLPGLRIDPDGTIIFNGEKIQHLLVDGEDIFSADPTAITRNLDASKIARVQILERKSDKAIFTGIDDGVRTKTVNLVMKESAKDGYFGKTEAGGGLNSYYNGNGALAGFKDKEQFMAIGLTANTGVLGFSSDAGGSTSQLSILANGSDLLDANAGIGIPHVVGAGLHYANSWSQSGEQLSTNYQYGQYSSEPLTTNQSIEIQSDSVYKQDQQAKSTNQQDRHWMYGTYEWISNPNSAARVEFGGDNMQEKNRYSSLTTSNFNDTLVNTGQRSIQDKVHNQGFNANGSWRTQFGKSSGHVFSLYAGLSDRDESTSGYLYSINKFYQSNGSIQSIDTVDQRKQLVNHSVNFSGGIYYKQPLWKSAFLGTAYTASSGAYEPLQESFNNNGGKYTNMIDSLSSDFQSRSINQTGEVNLQGKVGNLDYTLANTIFSYTYRQNELVADTSFRLSYLRWLPGASLRYSPNGHTKYKLDFRTALQLPTIDQLALKINNSDPLHIIIGNPSLRPASLRVFAFEFQRVKTWLINVWLNVTMINNNITTRTSIDSLGRQITQPTNVGGSYTSEIRSSVSKKLVGIDFEFHTVDNFSRAVNYINSNLNRNDIFNLGQGINVNKYVVGKYSLYLNANFTYLDQISSINTSVPVRYWAQSHTGGVTIFFVKNFEFNSNAIYTWQQKTSSFTGNNSTLLWNTSISRNFLKDKLVARFQINNLLNQNAGISRSYLNNTSSESATNILGRYWLLSAVYHFNHKFKRK